MLSTVQFGTTWFGAEGPPGRDLGPKTSSPGRNLMIVTAAFAMASSSSR